MIRSLTCVAIAIGHLTCFSPVTAAADNHQLEIETAAAADQALQQTEALITAVSFAFDYLATFIGEAAPPPAIIQAELKATTDRLEGVRSILLIDKNGNLLHDAFYPSRPEKNVADRDYFRQPLEQPGIHIGQAALGRTSGLPFAPLSIHKPALNLVLAAVVDLRKFREPLNGCMKNCGGAVLTGDGALIAISPPEAQISMNVIDRVMADKENGGQFFVERPPLKTLVTFRKSERFPIIILTFRSIATSGNMAGE